jgi:hypothetical protein
VKILEPAQHVVESISHAPDFVGARLYRSRREIPGPGARHRVPDQRDRAVNQLASEPVNEEGQQDDCRRREPERDLPALGPKLVDCCERDRRDGA